MPQTVAVLGATGYIGGRLVPALLAEGYTVRAIGRSAGKLQCRPWAHHPQTQIATADALDLASLCRALEGCHVLYYLVHSMAPGKGDFAQRDRQAAETARQAAAAAGVERIIYLGGLGDPETNLSEHLRSRFEVGQVLGAGPVPLTWLRAAVILGAGSASFEMIRYLTERLPVMVVPRWVDTPCQPIAVSNVLDYLVGVLRVPESAGCMFDIGGPEVLSYRQMLHLYAEVAGLPRRYIVGVPVLTLRLSSLWIHLVTPIPASLARPLAEGLRNPAVCRENAIQRLVPVRLLSPREAMARAIERTRAHQVTSCWSDAGPLPAPEWASCADPHYAGGTVFQEAYAVEVDVPPQRVWEVITRLGGETGWLFANRLWAVRGGVDRLLGGVGLRRGRRHPTDIRIGDALDFWRVLDVVPGERLVLLAEMRLPGEAVFDLRLSPHGGGSRVELRARYRPKGLWGMVYWQALVPAHRWLFRGFLKRLAWAAGARRTQNPYRLPPSSEDACTLSY